MKRRLLSLSAIAAIVIATSAAVAQQAPKPETLIKWRQSAFQTIAWNTNRIKGSLDNGYNKDDVARAANTLSALANSGLFNLFVPGTDQGKGWHETTARPEIFKDSKRFNELGANFAKEASELARIAPAGDAAAVKEQFGKVARTCKGCHDDFKGND
jgi:cytochrome c556